MLKIGGATSLAYPAGATPGLDPSHVALRNAPIVRFTGVAMGGSFVEIQQGQPGTLQGAATATFSGLTGPAVRCTANGDYVSFAGLTRAITTTEQTLTLAGIFRYVSNAVRSGVLCTSTLLNTGYGFGSFNSTPFIIGPGNSERTFAGLGNFVAGNSYFFVVSNTSGGTTFALSRDLTTGRVTTTSAAAVTGLFPTNGTYGVGSSPSLGAASNGVGAIAAACHINKQIGLPEMLQWSEDPWAFWYPAVRGFQK